MYDVIIIGAGPAGMAAAVKAANEKLKTLVIAKDLAELKTEFNLAFFDVKKLVLEFHRLIKEKALECLNKTEAVNLEKNVVSFSIEDRSGKIYYSKAVIIATGFDFEKNLANTDFEKSARKDFTGKIVVNNGQASSVRGLFASGGAGNGLSQDVFYAVSDGVRAVYGVKQYLES